MQEFFFAIVPRNHRNFKEYAERRFVEIYGKSDISIGNGKTETVFIDDLEYKYAEYIDKLIYNTCGGDVTAIEALEGRKTYIEFLSVVNNYLEKTRLQIEANEKLNKELKSK